MYARIVKFLQLYLGLSVFRVLSRPLDPQSATPVSGAVRFVRMSEEDLLRHCADPALELPWASARAALARGDVCVGALKDGRLLGYAWFAFGSTPETASVWLEFDPRVRYSYRHFVRPACRGQRIAAGLLPAADALCAERGRTRCLTLIRPHNEASIRASERTGARTVGYAAYLKVFGRLLCWRSAGARELGLRFFRPQSNLRPFSLAMRRLASMLAATASRN
jgi:GNAT superfamily N-acetyltransferase